MSELPSAGRSQQARRRRRTRHKGAIASSLAGATSPSLQKSATTQARSGQGAAQVSGPLKAAEVVETPASEPEAIALDTQVSRAPWWRSRLTPLTKRILFWGGLTGLATLAFSIGINLALAPFAATQDLINKNQTLLQVGFCLSNLVVLALPFAAGLLVVRREGTARQGGMAGAVSAVCAAVLGLVVSVVLLAIQGQPFTGSDLLSYLESDLFTIAIGFGMGYVGGRYIVWKRMRTQKQQEATAAS